ncbi:SMP-30/gluconolactonase/LRE family protein [Flagellimonas halotolerans]|uniref:Gluconolaconase n=1 Tax=Flagellimonas halotolerans TaxID=3112164 RepID=A0ABU6ISX4_9FLAO|nr:MULTISPECIES: gluconolaconase [unclassified Allomuricauda]MEC3966362.1 gluconolaconase [Muricauda sp. SYSU M86414]MEC4266227.1 gluconolaconase [Muricauda sp. SYSU M84420]
MKKMSFLTRFGLNQVTRYILPVTMVLISGCTSQSDIQFPVEVGVKPESITKGFAGNYYVTVMNGGEEGDGEVVEIFTNGTKVFAEGFNEPKGIVHLKDHLYFSDLTRIWKVDKDGNATIFIDKEDFPEEVLYLNDVAVDAENNGIYVTDMGATKYMRDENNELWPLDSEKAKLVPQLGRIYHVDLDGQVSIAQNTSSLMLNPNGVGVDNNGDIMVGAFFLGNFLVKKDGELTPLKGLFRGADAVGQDSKGNYYVSSWAAGAVWKIDGKTEESTVLMDGLQSAADFYLEEDKGRLLLPDMLAGKVYEVDINK